MLGRKGGEPFDRGGAEAYALEQFRGAAEIDGRPDERTHALDAFVGLLREEGFLTLPESPKLLLDDREHQLQVAAQPWEWERLRARRGKPG
ncbi:MAG: hypothetical protein M3P49_12110 [Actinomycetota bacterium]|nr:hypothetical protein [Actinomycetota bacterium]